MSRLDKIRSMNDDELIAFLESTEMRNRLVSVAQKKVQIAIHTPARIAKRE